MTTGLEAYRAGVTFKKRRDILKAALEEFQRVGFHEAGMKEISARANVSTATLYKHAGSKEHLFEQVVEQEKVRGGQAGVNALVARIAFAGICALAEDATTYTQNAISVLGDFVAALENVPKTDEAA